MTEQEKAPSLGDVVGAAAFAISLITAWLYVAGWTYAYAYFDQFRIPLILTELPHEHVFVYGGLAIWKNPAATAAVVGMAASTAFVGIRFRTSLGRTWLAVITIVSVAALFAVARLAGSHTAIHDVAVQRANDFEAYPRVLIEFADEAKLNSVQAAAASGCARLVLATGDRLFLIAPRRDMPALELNTFVIPWDGAASVAISALGSNCP